ncbi:MAG: copper ion binding protein, partial [Candidatus Eisenbacteria bacterium]|nr:copper ion binding protein [Candidatus Latescibacterota bacterium]MBD3302311.1 copper ion binding protein [Candidatus Eisenbacteria bacterium]
MDAKTVTEPRRLTIRVDGMTCGGCEQTVQQRLGALEGVRAVIADAEAGRAVLEVDRAPSAEEVERALSETKFRIPRERQHLIVDGMTCEGCAGAVRDLLSAVPLVESVDVDLSAGRAVVLHRGVPVEDLLAVFERDGVRYEARPCHAEPVEAEACPVAPPPSEEDRPLPAPESRIVHGTVHLAVTGMTCASCVAKVEKALAARPGVGEANVSFAAGTAMIRTGEAGTDLGDLISAIRSAGPYEAKPLDGEAGDDELAAEQE